MVEVDIIEPVDPAQWTSVFGIEPGDPGYDEAVIRARDSLDHPLVYVSEDAEKSTLVEIGRTTGVSLEELESLQQWNSAFRQGEKGKIVIAFAVFPDWAKGWIAERVQGVLEARGVKTWKAADWEGDALAVYFITGLAPVAIIALVAGALVFSYITLRSITLYKLQSIPLYASIDRQRDLNQAIIQAENEAAAAKTPGDREKAREKATNLKHQAAAEREHENQLSENLGKADAPFGLNLEKPLMVAVVMAVLVFGFILFMQFRRA